MDQGQEEKPRRNLLPCEGEPEEVGPRGKGQVGHPGLKPDQGEEVRQEEELDDGEEALHPLELEGQGPHAEGEAQGGEVQGQKAQGPPGGGGEPNPEEENQGKKGKEVKGDAGETLHEGAQEKLPEKPSSGQAQVLQGA